MLGIVPKCKTKAQYIAFCVSIKSLTSGKNRNVAIVKKSQKTNKTAQATAPTLKKLPNTAVFTAPR
jgi:hypothetical protein